MQKNPDIKRRVLFVALMPASIICVALSLYFIALRYNEADAVLLARGAALTRQLAPAAEYGAFSGNRVELRRLAEAVAHEADVTAVTFYDRDGQLLVGVGATRYQGNFGALHNDWQGLSADGRLLVFHAKIQRSAPTFDDPFTTPGGLPQTNEPLGSVTVEMSRDNVVRTKKEIVVVTLLFALATLAAGILFSRRLSRDVTEPIVALQQTVAQIHLGHLDARVDLHPAQTLRNLEEGINEMAAALETGRDHLEQRIAEATLELREKKDEAERTSQAKSRFLAAASHDLRQPLHALTLFTDDLRQQTSNPGHRRLLKHISSAVHALNEQLSALLDISRLDLGNIRTQVEPVELEPLLERAIAVHAPDAEAKGLRLRHVPTRARVLSDARLLERMLGNLLSNAIRYTEHGGIVVGVRHCGERVRLVVCDSGIGISNEQIPLIFQEFYQVGNPERDAEKGLGLGLSIVARLAHILGHPVDVRSQLEHGSTFSIELPRAPGAAGAADTEATHTEEAPRDNLYTFDIAVLVLGESAEQRASLCGLLEGWGCRTACAGSVGEYEDKVRGGADRPDVVIFSASRRNAMQRFVARYPEPPILIMLGEADAEESLALGETEIPCAQLASPVRPARLRALLQRLLQPPTEEEEEDGSENCPAASLTT